MTQTVIGIFKNANDARDAADKLLSDDFSQANVDFSSGVSAANYSTKTTGTENESGIVRFFKNLFGDDDNERERYTKAAEHGAVVTVHAQDEDEARRASLLLDEYGAIDVNDDDNYFTATDEYDTTTGSGYGTGNEYSTTTDDFNATNKNTNDTYADESEGRTIPVIEENLQVGKREVETGGVRLRSRIIEKPVEESLRLREEHIRIERNTVDRPATEADFDNFKEGSVELTEHAEVPVVSKEARVVEEISLDKEVEHHEETVRDTVRKTEVDIEETGTNKKGKRKN